MAVEVEEARFHLTIAGDECAYSEISKLWTYTMETPLKLPPSQ
jgi:hypothetical protein